MPFKDIDEQRAYFKRREQLKRARRRAAGQTSRGETRRPRDKSDEDLDRQAAEWLARIDRSDAA